MTTGRCLCGSIRYQYSGNPTLVVHCHCDSCRRQTGSAMTTFVIVPKSALHLSSGQPREYASSPGVWRGFCGDCGSAMYYRTDRRPDVIDLFAGTLDDASALAPECHVHATEQLPWFEVLDELPRYPGTRWGDRPVQHGPRR